MAEADRETCRWPLWVRRLWILLHRHDLGRGVVEGSFAVRPHCCRVERLDGLIIFSGAIRVPLTPADGL